MPKLDYTGDVFKEIGNRVRDFRSDGGTTEASNALAKLSLDVHLATEPDIGAEFQSAMVDTRSESPIRGYASMRPEDEPTDKIIHRPRVDNTTDAEPPRADSGRDKPPKPPIKKPPTGGGGSESSSNEPEEPRNEPNESSKPDRYTVRMGYHSPEEAKQGKAGAGPEGILPGPKPFREPPEKHDASLLKFSEQFEARQASRDTPEPATETPTSVTEKPRIDAAAIMETIPQHQIERIRAAAEDFMPTDSSSSLSELNSAPARVEAELPALITAAAEARVPAESAVELLAVTMEAIKNPGEVHAVVPAAYLEKVFTQDAPTLGDADIQRLKALFPHADRAEGGYDSTLDTLQVIAQSLHSGMSINEALDLADKFGRSEQQTERPDPQHYVRPSATMVEAIQALNAVPVNPQALKYVMEGLLEVPTSGSQYVYGNFITSVANCVGEHKISAADLIEDIAFRMQNGVEPGTAIRQTIDQAKRDATHPNISERSKMPDVYFVPKQGGPRFEHSPVPYQGPRSLNELVDDLHTLAVANPYRGEPARPGTWAFAYKGRGAGTGYNMGGLPDRSNIEVNNKVYPFDLSRLSDQPALFHLRPRSSAVGSQYANIFPTYRNLMDSFAAKQTMSKGTVPLRTFIVSPYGTTHVEHPQGNDFNPGQITTVSGIIQNFVGRLGNLAYYDPTVADTTRSLSPSGFAAWCTERANEQLNQLSPGYSLHFYPAGIDLEAELVQRSYR